MATKVSYKQGTKATYLGLSERLPSALYFCTDTRELFKGDDLYSDGLRVVDSFAALPDFNAAADGVLYVCADSGCGYTPNKARNAWQQVVYGADDKTLEVNESGLMQVKAVPVSKVEGLDEHIGAIVEKAVGDLEFAVAAQDKAGAVKPSADFSIAEDGTLSLMPIEAEKIAGLSSIAKAEPNEHQFEIKDGVLSLTAADSAAMTYRGESLQSVLDSLSKAATWGEL